MEQRIRERLRAATAACGDGESDFVDILKKIEEHYDRMEETLARTIEMRGLHDNTSIEAIFDSVTEALFSVSEDGIIRNCNKVCSSYFGLQQNELVGAHIAKILPVARGQAIDKFLAPFTHNLDNKRIEQSGGEIEALRADGTSFVSEINASEMATATGSLFVISLRDVTGRRQAETALKENEERYRALVENAPEAIIVFDVENDRFTDANDIACSLFKMSRAHLLTVGPKAISPEMQLDGTKSFGVRRGYVERALNGEHPIFEWLHQDSTGRPVPCEVRFSRLPSDERQLIRVSVTDISARKRNEAITHAQNTVLEMIAASVPIERTLRAICRYVEEIHEGYKAAVSRFDKKSQTLLLEEAPSLPGKFVELIKFVDVGEIGMTSGSAVHHAEDRFTPDICEDVAWAPAREQALHCSVAAAWSFLLYAQAGEIIGTLDIFLDRPRTPRGDELDKLRRMARLAGIAIQRQRDESKLKSSESRYRGLFENVIDGVYITSRDGDFIAANPALVEMLGYDDVDDLKAAGKTSILYVNPIDRERVFARLEADGVVKNFEYRLRRKDGGEIVVLENSRAIYDEDGAIVAHEGTITDITERKRAETRIFEEKERAQVTLQSIGDGVITTDADGNVDYLNPVAQDLTGWNVRAARGTHISKIMMIVNEQTRAPVDNPVVRCLKEGRVVSLAENSVLITAGEEEVAIQDSAAPIRDRIGNIVGAVMVFHDISKESRLARQISYQAAHDPLTGLVNRREFENRLGRVIDQAKSIEGASHALLYIDLDQFKVVNDTFGHNAGDALLSKMSKCIQRNIRSTDLLGRLGGDEFGVLLERCDEERAMQVAEAIRMSIEEYRFDWQSAFTNVRCSIGIVMVTQENADIAEVLSSADVACYSAKDMGRNRVHLYRHSDVSLRHEEMKWVSRITSAVEDNRLELFFQPIIRIAESRDKRPDHYELLLRMRDEDGELVRPDLFIPSAERYNLMSTLDRWVIHEALSTLADRNPHGEARYSLAINLSGSSLSEDRFLDFVVKELQKQQLPDGAICFEITETAAISSLSQVVHFMNALKKLGCKFSLDDFGSGLSSFSYLKNLPVDFLKIDGHFIRNVAEDRVDKSMVRAIHEVGAAMGIATIAERVENEAVLKTLGEIGIEYAQGFHIARPAPVSTFESWAGEMSSLRSA
ncbi:MAG: EAL domain-containing protein [Gammaproteobacteria bacterium]|nr:EAL domain-containing protein [Gammaproteobacteria bacterium]